MNVQDPQTGEDYVLAPGRRVKITRTRKMLIGILAVSTVAAVAGAGTFASFSASTTNESSFSTQKLVLGNKVGAGTTCLSNVGQADLDLNDKACDALLASTLDWGSEYSKDIIITAEESATTGTLKLFADAACSATSTGSPAGTATSTEVCNAVSIQVQEYTAANFNVPSGTCAYGSSAGSACSAFSTGTLFPTFSSAINLSTLANATPRYFRVKVKTVDGGYTAAGIGNDNKFMNKTATLKLRWLLQDA